MREPRQPGNTLPLVRRRADEDVELVEDAVEAPEARDRLHRVVADDAEEVRDGLELAQEPFDTRWGIWSVQAVNLIEDLHDLIELKLRHMGRVAG